jgi:hypothetical protein
MENVRIEIADESFTTKSGTSKKGEPYTIHRQEGYLHNGHKYPERFEFAPPEVDGKPIPYKAGFYTIAPSSLKVGEYKDLEINRYEFKLLRLDEPAKPAKP